MPKKTNLTEQPSFSVNPGGCIKRSSALLRAVLDDNEAEVKRELKHLDYWPDLYIFDGQNRNPLVEAIKKENYRMVHLMVKHPKLLAGVCKDREGNTPFHYIDKVKSGFKRRLLAEELIAKGMRIDLTNDADKKPVFYKDYLKIEQDLAKQRQVIERRWLNRLQNALFIKVPAEATLKYTGAVMLATFGLYLFAGMMNVFVSPVVGVAFMAYWYACLELSANKAPDMRQLQIEQLNKDFLFQVKRGKLTAKKLDTYLKQGVELCRDLRKDEYAVNNFGDKIKTKSTEYHLLDFAKDYGSKDSVKLIERALQSNNAPAITPSYTAKLRKNTHAPVSKVKDTHSSRSACRF